MGSLLSSLFNAVGNEECDGTPGVTEIHDKSSWDEHWNANRESNKLVLIDFYAKWCGPCRFIAPTFKALAAKNADIAFLKVDVDEVPEVTQQWKVQAMPTFVLVKGGEEKGRVVGAKMNELEMMIQRHVKN